MAKKCWRTMTAVERDDLMREALKEAIEYQDVFNAEIEARLRILEKQAMGLDGKVPTKRYTGQLHVRGEQCRPSQGDATYYCDCDQSGQVGHSCDTGSRVLGTQGRVGEPSGIVIPFRR